MFHFTLGSEDQPRVYESLPRARAQANRLAAKRQVEIEVIRDEDDQVVHIATYVEGRYFYPFERVETPGVPNARHFDGFIPAYQRKRAGAVVYRRLDEKAWLVHDTVTGGRRLVRSTRAACLLTNQMNPNKQAIRIPASERGETQREA